MALFGLCWHRWAHVGTGGMWHIYRCVKCGKSDIDVS